MKFSSSKTPKNGIAGAVSPAPAIFPTSGKFIIDLIAD